MPVLDTGRDMKRESLLDIARGLASLLHTKPSFFHINHLTALVAVPLGARAGIEVIAVHADVGGTPLRDRAGEVGGIECRCRRRRRSLLSCMDPDARQTQSEDSEEHE